MNKAVLIVFYIAFINNAFAAPKTYGDFTVSKLISVYDGDTIRVDLSDCTTEIVCKNIGIRVFGIDTPEIRGKCAAEKRLAKQARKRMREILASGEAITLKDTRRGKYFRIVARVFVGDIEAADLLIDEGLGFRYFGGKKQSWCK